MDTQTSVAGNTRSGGGYITVDGVRTYYEVTGTGEPLLLLHGGLMTAESWDPQVPTLAQQYRVYVLEQFGQGRTPDVDGPLAYETMAQHTTAFLDALGISSAHLCGWSDGALVALLVALRRPSLVRKIVHVDCFITLDDAPAGYLDFIRAMTVDTAPPPVVQAYAALSPDGPEHFPVVFDKLHRTWTEPTGLEVADLAKITAPSRVRSSASWATTHSAPTKPDMRNTGINSRAGSSASRTSPRSSPAAWPVACARSYVCTRNSTGYRSSHSPSGICPPHGNGTGRASAAGSSAAIMSARAARRAATGSSPAAGLGSAGLSISSCPVA